MTSASKTTFVGLFNCWSVQRQARSGSSAERYYRVKLDLKVGEHVYSATTVVDAATEERLHQLFLQVRALKFELISDQHLIIVLDEPCEPLPAFEYKPPREASALP